MTGRKGETAMLLMGLWLIVLAATINEYRCDCSEAEYDDSDDLV